MHGKNVSTYTSKMAETSVLGEAVWSFSVDTLAINLHQLPLKPPKSCCFCLFICLNFPHRSKQLLPQTQRSHNNRQAGLQAPQLQRHEAGESQQLPVSLRLRCPGGVVCVLCDSGSRDKRSERCDHVDVQRASAGRDLTYSYRPHSCIQRLDSNVCLTLPHNVSERRWRRKMNQWKSAPERPFDFSFCSFQACMCVTTARGRYFFFLKKLRGPFHS